MKKLPVILFMILFFSSPTIMAKTLCIRLWQSDDYVSFPPIKQAYAEKLKTEGLVVNVLFANIYNRKTTNYDIVVCSLDLHERIRIEKFEFEFDGKTVKIDVKKSFEFPSHYFNRFDEETTKQRIDFQKMFKSHLKENEKTPVKVSIFYALDDRLSWSRCHLQ